MPNNPKSLPGWFSIIMVYSLCLGVGLVSVYFYRQMSYLHVEADVPQGSVFQVFYDCGNGFREQDSRRYDLATSIFRRRILLPDEIALLRIDPVNSDQPVQFRKLAYKAPGRLFGLDLLELDNLQFHAVESFETNQAGIGVFKPESKTGDPFVIVDVSDSETDNIGFVLLSVSVSFAALMVFLLVRIILLMTIRYAICLWERLATLRTSHIPGVRSIISSLLIGIVIAVVVDTTNAGLLKNHYTLRFSLQSPESHSIGVFFDQGYGFGDRNLVYRQIQETDQLRTRRFSFDAIRSLVRIRIDPGNHAGYSLLEGVQIRRGSGDWQRLDLSKWKVKQGIRIDKQDSRQIAMYSPNEDPFVVSNTLEPNTGSIGFSFRRLVVGCGIFLLSASLLLAYGYYRQLRRDHIISVVQSIEPSSSILWGFSREEVLTGCGYLLLMLICFAGYYPGGLCGDTVGDIRAALEGVVGARDPAILQVGARILQHLTIRQWPMLLIQLGLHFCGFWLLSLYCLRKGSRVFAYLTMLLSVSPPMLYIHTLVVKDVLVGVLWVNAVGITLLSTIKGVGQGKRVILRGFAILLILLSVLSRDNSFLAAPALFLMLIGCDGIRRFGVGAFWKYTTVFVCLLLASFGFMQVVNRQLNTGNENRDYSDDFLVKQTCTTDLIGLSVVQDHQGVTAVLDRREKLELERLYRLHPVFWLERTLFHKMFPGDVAILRDWQEAVLNHPLLYLKHRSHLLASLFVGRADMQMMWVSQSTDAHWTQERLGVDEATARKFIVPEGWRNNSIYRWSRAMFRSYFKTVSGPVGVLLLVYSLVVCVWMLLRMWIKRWLRPVEWIVFHAILAALCYVIPDFFFVQHSETRYVYPALMLFFVSFLIFLENNTYREPEKPE